MAQVTAELEDEQKSDAQLPNRFHLSLGRCDRQQLTRKGIDLEVIENAMPIAPHPGGQRGPEKGRNGRLKAGEIANDDVVEFTYDPTNVNTPWNVSLDFNPNRNNLLNDNGFLRYKFEIDPILGKGRVFDQIKLANQGDITNGKYEITKSFWNSDFTTQVITDVLINPTTPDGISVANLGLTTLYVWDKWNVQPGANGSINSLQNSFGQKVPGPLPLVGIGAAFGLSRRIRSRIKGARLS
jgi:hypothetical protein